MTSSEPSWELWRSFLAVAQTGSLSGAARALRLTQPTVGRHVDALESDLGVPLFTRSPSGLRPTAAATELVPQARAMAAAAEGLVRSAARQREDEGGTVRVSASEIVGTQVLPPILAAFGERARACASSSSCRTATPTCCGATPTSPSA